MHPGSSTLLGPDMFSFVSSSGVNSNESVGKKVILSFELASLII